MNQGHTCPWQRLYLLKEKFKLPSFSLLGQARLYPHIKTIKVYRTRSITSRIYSTGCLLSFKVGSLTCNTQLTTITTMLTLLLICSGFIVTGVTIPAVVSFFSMSTKQSAWIKYQWVIGTMRANLMWWNERLLYRNDWWPAGLSLYIVNMKSGVFAPVVVVSISSAHWTPVLIIQYKFNHNNLIIPFKECWLESLSAKCD